MDYIMRADVLDKGFVELIDVMGNDMAVTQAARVSYLSESKGEDKDRKLLNYLWQNGHHSCFEQVELKFRVKTPLFVFGQWVRHRMANLNVQSFRYTEVEDDFYIPYAFRGQDNKNKQGSTEYADINHREYQLVLEQHCNNSLILYNQMLDAGVAREMARMVIPQNIYTMFIWKIDLRNLLHFLDLRADSHAQWEIQQYANAIKLMVKEKFPWTYEAWANE